MNYTQFHGNTFLFINKNTSEFPLPKESKEVDLTMYYETIVMTYEDTRKQYTCDFVNKDGSEASLCCNALFRLMEQEGEGHYVFHTISGLYEGWNKKLYYSDPEACEHLYTAENGQMISKKPLYACSCKICGNSFANSKNDANVCWNCSENELAIRMPKAKIKYQDCYKIEIDIDNPHLIFFDDHDDLYKCNIAEYNTHYSKQINANTFKVCCFEKGIGETQACSSGAYAVGIAMIKHFNFNEVKIIMKGGEYTIKDGFLIVKKYEQI